jgi:two-component system, OmpR family, response regulator
MKGKVLVIDDEEAYREFIVDALRQAGYEAFEARNCGEALSIARRNTLAAAITDMVMPEMSGAEFMTRLRSGGSRMPIIAITGHPDGDRVLATSENSVRADLVLHKPFMADDICLAVKQVIAGKTPVTG